MENLDRWAQGGEFQLSTFLSIPCRDSRIRAVFEQEDVMAKYGRVMLPRIVVDAQLKQFLLRQCPIAWHVYKPLETWLEALTGHVTTGETHLRYEIYDKDEATSIQLLRDLVSVFTHMDGGPPLNPSFVSQWSIWPVYNPYKPLSTYPTHVPMPPPWLPVPSYSNLYLRKKNSFNFITCAESKAYITLEDFHQGFTLDFWVVAILSFILIVLLLLISFKCYRLADGAVLILAKVILEQGFRLSETLKMHNGFKIFLSSFLLVSLILTNLYRGEVTKNMTAPFPQEQLKSVQEAVDKGLRILVPIPNTNEHPWQNDWIRIMEANRHNKTGDAPNHSTNLEFLFYHFTANYMRYSYLIRAFAMDITGLGEFNSTTSERRHPGMLKSLKIIGVRPDSADLELELMKCNNTIYVDEKFKLDAIMMKAKQINPKNATKLYYGSDEFLPHNSFWMMGPILFDRINVIHTRMQSILHSGIFDHAYEGVWSPNYKSKSKFITALTKDDDGSAVRQLSMQTNMVIGVFYIYGTCISACFLIIFLEIVKIMLSVDNTIVTVLSAPQFR